MQKKRKTINRQTNKQTNNKQGTFTSLPGQKECQHTWKRCSRHNKIAVNPFFISLERERIKNKKTRKQKLPKPRKLGREEKERERERE